VVSMSKNASTDGCKSGFGIAGRPGRAIGFLL
jgi:hypothetical protein